MPKSLASLQAVDSHDPQKSVLATSIMESTEEEDRLFRQFAESLPLMIWAADRTGKKIYCNQRYLRYIGVLSPSGMDQGWYLAVHPKDRERAKRTWDAAVRNASVYECEYQLRRADGNYRIFIARAVPLTDDKGQVVRWIGSSIDLHEDRLAETNRRQAEKLLAASRCATSVAHQINNPLSGAMNAIYLAQQDATVNDVTRSYLETAASEVARVAQVTAHSLGFHKQSVKLQKADAILVLDSVLSFFESRILEQGLILRRKARSAPPVICYKEDLSQAISAVLINAVQAS